MRVGKARSGLAACIVLVAYGTQAAINYGDFAGTSVMYIDVTEDSGTDPGSLPLYGAPTISGNTLDFDPTFFASATNGSLDQTDGQLKFDVYAQTGSIVGALGFAEAGDFSILGLGTDLTFVDVTANFFVEVYEVDGVAIDEVSTAVQMVFAPNGDGTFALATDGGGGPLYQGIWSGGVNVDLLSLLDDNSIEYEYGATKVSVVLDNVLTALSEDGTTSYIAKKDFSGLSITSTGIPEPSSVLLMSFGLFGLIGLKKKLSM